MNDHPSTSAKALTSVDPKVQSDWDAVEARRADISTREGGDTRRRAILACLELLKHAS